MPFEKVETQQVDFPALERGVLEFWQRTRAFEKLRTKNRGGPRWSFLDGPITANNPMGVHHAWGRTYKDAFQRYFAMTGQRAALPERLRLPGAVGRGRGREGAEAAIEARHREPRARRHLRQHRPLRAAVQGARRQVRPRADRAVDPPGLLDGLGPRRGLAEAAGRAAQLFHDVGGEQLHHLELPQEVPRSRPGLPRLRRHAVVSALLASASARWRWPRAISWSPTGPCSCASRCAAGRARTCSSGPPRPGR